MINNKTEPPNWKAGDLVYSPEANRAVAILKVNPDKSFSWVWENELNDLEEVNRSLENPLGWFSGFRAWCNSVIGHVGKPCIFCGQDIPIENK